MLHYSHVKFIMATRKFDPYNDPDPDEMEWVIYEKGITKTPFETWLWKNLPSRVRKDEGYGWVCVSNGSEKRTAYEEEEDFDGLFDSWEEHLEAERPVNYEIIKDLALKHRILCGKWILFTDQGGKVDHLWSVIASSVVADDIPCFSAKVSTFEDDVNHVICIYNSDFTDKNEVLESEEAIRNMGLKGRLQYKPDIYTHLFIYAKNEWKLKPFTMTSQYNLLTKSSIIKSYV
ncbi:UPF0696 protein C11orf68 homolog isoform X2 [Mercenaria mercenaria]|uniref:UPF0696 protein C11orf68 homolog isoform X2 n=1 Tax=Mercenaria mercenaria TaxID=6596 RepID=UPI00234EC702|nr:UPF0696 protein C11orf68 homolog isoform X2 [Mercenaria mercenaria]